MKNKLPMKLTKTEVEEFSAVLGSAPVLTSESGRHYNEIWENLIVTFAPRDFMELLLIRQVQNETWKILRYTRHQTLGRSAFSRKSRIASKSPKGAGCAKRGTSKGAGAANRAFRDRVGASTISARNRNVVRRRCRRDIRPRAYRDRA